MCWDVIGESWDGISQPGPRTGRGELGEGAGMRQRPGLLQSVLEAREVKSKEIRLKNKICTSGSVWLLPGRKGCSSRAGSSGGFGLMVNCLVYARPRAWKSRQVNRY